LRVLSLNLHLVVSPLSCLHLLPDMITLEKLSMQFLCFNPPLLAPITTSDMFGLLKNWEWNGNSYKISHFLWNPNLCYWRTNWQSSWNRNAPHSIPNFRQIKHGLGFSSIALNESSQEGPYTFCCFIPKLTHTALTIILIWTFFPCSFSSLVQNATGLTISMLYLGYVFRFSFNILFCFSLPLSLISRKL